MSVQQQNKAIFHRFIEAVNRGDEDALDALIQPGFVRHSQATAPLTIESLEAFKVFLRQDRTTFPDLHMEKGLVIAEGDKVAAYMTLRGTQEGPVGPFPATGKPVSVPFLAMLRFEAGKIAEMWVEWDNLKMLKQLGHFPPPGMNTE